MQIPAVDADAVKRAIRDFDGELRSSEPWARWEDNRAQTYAIAYEGKLYPPKKIVSMATGLAVSSFSGGPETNLYLEARGFAVQRLRDSKLHDVLSLILERYGQARATADFAGHHEIRELFDRARRLIAASEPVSSRASLHVVASYGKGNWATVPWISVLDERETRTTQEGTYVVYLFREDGKGCYVKVAQGVTRVENELGASALTVLTERAAALRKRFSELASVGFDMSGKSDLGAGNRLARLYEASTVAAKYYAASDMPNDDVLFADLEHLLGAYEGVIDKKDKTEIPALDQRPIAIIGTWRSITEQAQQVQQSIDTRGGWASPWSFPIKTDALARLATPFHLYANVGRGELAGRLRIDEIVTSRGNEGIVSPWPDITDDGWTNLTRSGPKQSELFRTWLRIGDVELLDPAILVHDLDLVIGLSTPENVLSQSTFGYIYDIVPREPAPSPDRPNSALNVGIDWLLTQTGLKPELLKEMLGSLRGRFPQILLAGPPGTSKTWVAQQLAIHLTGGRGEAVRLVQFHPSYSYESFIEGLRPVAKESGISFELTPGIVVEMVIQMKRNGDLGKRDRPYVIIIDEANRANLPKVLGELMYLFEYRNQMVRLQYSSNFSLPENLFFIGTMNTADQSIRTIDVALRRRFDVFELPPDADILSRYFGASQTVPNGLIEGFLELNRALEGEIDRHHTIGHAFLMIPDPTWKDVQSTWDRRVFPLIEEYFFDRPDLAKQFTVERFWPQIRDVL